MKWMSWVDDFKARYRHHTMFLICIFSGGKIQKEITQLEAAPMDVPRRNCRSSCPIMTHHRLINEKEPLPPHYQSGAFQFCPATMSSFSLGPDEFGSFLLIGVFLFSKKKKKPSLLIKRGRREGNSNRVYSVSGWMVQSLDGLGQHIVRSDRFIFGFSLRKPQMAE